MSSLAQTEFSNFGSMDNVPSNYPEESSTYVQEYSGSQISLSGYHPNGTMTVSNQPEIVTNIQQLPNIESEVIVKAVEIYYRINAESINSGESKTGTRTKSIKGSRKTRLIFYCVFLAYMELKSSVDPCYAADLVGLSRKEIDTALTDYSPPGVNTINPETLIPFYIRQLNDQLKERGISYNVNAVVQGVNDVIKVCRSTDVGSEGIQNTPSRLVAISALYFYLNDMQGSKISNFMRDFETACCVSWACVRRYHERIEYYYNYNSQNDKCPNIGWLL